ncbi:MAG: hypothetical protein RLZZ553_252 [Verrucomicrobiota bacterium]
MIDFAAKKSDAFVARHHLSTNKLPDWQEFEPRCLDVSSPIFLASETTKYWFASVGKSMCNHLRKLQSAFICFRIIMTPDTTSKFGQHKPSPILSSLISIAQSAPHNWLGKQIAQLVRKIVVFSSKAPIDITIGEIRMRCHLRDNNSEYKFAFMPWRFDELEREYLVKHIPSNGIFVDIGANVGIYSLFVATHLSSSGRIIAMEPNPPAYGRLSFNISSTQEGRKEWPKVELLPVAVADVHQEIDLHLDAKNLGSSSVKNSAQSVGVVRVKCQPLTEILESLSINKVDAIKIDIEGAEDLALAPYLESAPDASLPDCIVMENSQHLWKLDLVGLLQKRGYRAAITTRMNTVYSRSV